MEWPPWCSVAMRARCLLSGCAVASCLSDVVQELCGRFRETCAAADVCEAAFCSARTFFARAFFAVALTSTTTGTWWCRCRVCSRARPFFRSLWELWITPSHPVTPSPCPRCSSPPHPGLSFRGRGCRAGKSWAAALATHGSKRVARARFSCVCQPSLVWGGCRSSLVWDAAGRRWCARRPAVVGVARLPPVVGVGRGRPSVVCAAAGLRWCARRPPVGGVRGGRPSVSGRRPPVGACARRPPVGGVRGGRPSVVCAAAARR